MSFYSRSFQQRQRVKTDARSNYEHYFKLHGLNSFQDLDYLLSRLLYFYDITKDSDNLVSSFGNIYRQLLQLKRSREDFLHRWICFDILLTHWFSSFLGNSITICD